MEVKTPDFIEKFKDQITHIMPAETILGQWWKHMNGLDKGMYTLGTFCKTAGIVLIADGLSVGDVIINDAGLTKGSAIIFGATLYGLGGVVQAIASEDAERQNAMEKPCGRRAWQKNPNLHETKNLVKHAILRPII